MNTERLYCLWPELAASSSELGVGGLGPRAVLAPLATSSTKSLRSRSRRPHMAQAPRLNESDGFEWKGVSGHPSPVIFHAGSYSVDIERARRIKTDIAGSSDALVLRRPFPGRSGPIDLDGYEQSVTGVYEGFPGLVYTVGMRSLKETKVVTRMTAHATYRASFGQPKHSSARQAVRDGDLCHSSLC